MYDRFFAFGCSFTNYKWPTWADYLHAGNIAAQYQNWALPGGGNNFIFESLIECVSTQKITKDDLVCIMWSHPYRIDDFTADQGWNLTGNMFEHQPQERIKYYNFDAMDLENCTLLSAAKLVLDGLKCDYYFTSIEDINWNYSAVFNIKIHQSMASFLNYKNIGRNVNDHNIYFWRETLPGDRHPSPKEHADFAKTMFSKLNIVKINNLYKQANDKIFGSDTPHRERYIYYPEKLNVNRI